MCLALQSCLNARFHRIDRQRWLNANLIAHTLHAHKMTDDIACCLSLVLPMHCAGELDGPFFNLNGNLVLRRSHHPLQSGFSCAGNGCVRSMRRCGELNIQVTG